MRIISPYPQGVGIPPANLATRRFWKLGHLQPMRRWLMAIAPLRMESEGPSRKTGSDGEKRFRAEYKQRSLCLAEALPAPQKRRRGQQMWRAGLLGGLFLVACTSPSHAFLDAIVTAADRAREELYEKFMMAKAIEQVKSLRDNYSASMRYYNYYKQLNQGKGILGNFAQSITDIGNQNVYDAQQQFKDDWIRDQGYRSNVEATFQKMDKYASQKVTYAGAVFGTALKGQEQGQKLSAAAATMDPKSPQRAIVQGQAWTVQLQAQTNANLAQLIDLNTRMYELEVERKKQDMSEWQLFQKSAEKVKQRMLEKDESEAWTK